MEKLNTFYFIFFLKKRKGFLLQQAGSLEPQRKALGRG